MWTFEGAVFPPERLLFYFKRSERGLCAEEGGLQEDFMSFC